MYHGGRLAHIAAPPSGIRPSLAQNHELVNKRLHGFRGHDLAPKNLVDSLNARREGKEAQVSGIAFPVYQSPIRKLDPYARVYKIP